MYNARIFRILLTFRRCGCGPRELPLPPNAEVGNITFSELICVLVPGHNNRFRPICANYPKFWDLSLRFLWGRLSSVGLRDVREPGAAKRTLVEPEDGINAAE